MTNEERTLALDYLEKMQKTYVDGEGYEAHPLPEWYALEVAIKALEQQPCEDCISRESLSKQMFTLEPIVIRDENDIPVDYYTCDSVHGVIDNISSIQPCEDCISRAEVRRVLSNEVFELMKLHTVNPEDNPKADAMAHGVNWSLNTLMGLPSVHPKYTDEEIDKAQAVEQAYVDKMVELAVEESRQKWLESFDTSSATKCFEAVNLLKQRLEGGE